jgi:hypothetical protein
VKGTAKPNFPRGNFVRKSKDALSKWEAIKKNFENREKRMKADLEEARKIWGKLGERFKWRQSLP